MQRGILNSTHTGMTDTELLPNHDTDHAIPPDTGSTQERFVYDPYGLLPTSDADWSAGNGMEWSFMYQSLRDDSEGRLSDEGEHGGTSG